MKTINPVILAYQPADPSRKGAVPTSSTVCSMCPSAIWYASPSLKAYCNVMRVPVYPRETGSGVEGVTDCSAFRLLDEPVVAKPAVTQSNSGSSDDWRA